MQVSLKYSFANGNQSLLGKANNFFQSLDMESEIRDDRVFAEKEYDNRWDDEPVDVVFLRKAIEDCGKMGSALKTDFVLAGVIDTSAEAGECKDFELTCKNGSITAKASDWYVEEAMDSYESYEDFCDGFAECSREEYEKIKDLEFVYLLQTSDGEVLSGEVPLYDVTVK